MTHLGTAHWWATLGYNPTLQGCCDGLWLPSVDTPNLLAYAEEQAPRYRITVQPNGTVTWTTRMVGTWYSPFDFRAYPFDHQHLLMELSLADVEARHVGLAWEHVAKLNNTAHTKGPDLSGWRINWAKSKLYDSRACLKRYNITTSRYTPPTASSPDVAAYDPVLPGQRYLPPDNNSGTTRPEDCGELYRGPTAVYRTRLADVYGGKVQYPYWEAGGALYGPVVLVADIMVRRASSPYVLSNLLPTIIISLAVYIVFFLPCDALGDRMTIVMTAFLSITALQFMFDTPPAVYMNALQQAVLLSYVMYLVAALESMVVHRIVTVSRTLSNKRQCVSKYGGLLNTARRNALSARLRSAGSVGKQPGGTHSGEAPGPHPHPRAHPRGTRVRRASVTSVASHCSYTQQLPQHATAAAGGGLDEPAAVEGRGGHAAPSMRRGPSRRPLQHRPSAGSSDSGGPHGLCTGIKRSLPVGAGSAAAAAAAAGGGGELHSLPRHVAVLHGPDLPPTVSWDAAGGGATHTSHPVEYKAYSLSAPWALAPPPAQQYPPPMALPPAAALADLSPAAAAPVSTEPSYGTPFGRRAISERQPYGGCMHPREPYPTVLPPPSLLTVGYPPLPPPSAPPPAAPSHPPEPAAGDPARIPLVHPYSLNSTAYKTAEDSGPEAPTSTAATGADSHYASALAHTPIYETSSLQPPPGYPMVTAADPEPDIDTHTAPAAGHEAVMGSSRPTSRWGRLLRRCCRVVPRCRTECCTGSPWGCHRSSFWWLVLMLAWEWLKSVVRAPRVFYAQCKADEAFGLFVARRIDFWCCLILFVLYAVAFAVLVYVGVQVGDHKLMLGDRPGNM